MMQRPGRRCDLPVSQFVLQFSVPLNSKRRDGLHEPIVQWTKGRCRGDPIAKLVAQ